MALRSAHGAARKGGRLLMVETLPADELPSAMGSDPGRSDRDAHGRFVAGNRVGRTARIRAGHAGELGALERQGDAAWQVADRWSRRWARFRIAELTRAHGGELSSEVCGIVEDARQAMADARYCRARAAAIESADPVRADRLRAEARQLRIECRGHRLAAWELAAREAAARPRDQAADFDRRLAEMSARGRALMAAQAEQAAQAQTAAPPEEPTR